MKSEGYPQGVTWAILGRAKYLAWELDIPREAALERAVQEFVSRSSTYDRERARMEIDELIHQIDRMSLAYPPVQGGARPRSGSGKARGSGRPT